MLWQCRVPASLAAPYLVSPVLLWHRFVIDRPQYRPAHCSAPMYHLTRPMCSHAIRTGSIHSLHHRTPAHTPTVRPSFREHECMNHRGLIAVSRETWFCPPPGRCHRTGQSVRLGHFEARGAGARSVKTASHSRAKFFHPFVCQNRIGSTWTFTTTGYSIFNGPPMTQPWPAALGTTPLASRTSPAARRHIFYADTPAP